VPFSVCVGGELNRGFQAGLLTFFVVSYFCYSRCESDARERYNLRLALERSTVGPNTRGRSEVLSRDYIPGRS
jgi:hypothetical protein